MKIVTVNVLFIFSALMACHSNTNYTIAKPVMADTAKFYPLAAFFKSQIQYVDLRNFPIYKITLQDGKKDSVSLNKEEFISWAGIFLARSISDPTIKGLYTETVFHDLSTASYTLNYTTADTAAEVRNIDILLDEETNNVKRIFIKSLYKRGDTSIEEQCNWKAFKSFQVNRSLQTHNGYNRTSLNYINWNDKP